jgi:uncharacterized protein (TIGR02246 family)
MAWAKEFTDDSDFVDIRGNALHGRGEIGAHVTASLRARLKWSHLSLTVRQFSLLTPDVALVETDYEVTGLQGSLPGIAFTEEGVLKTRMKYVAVKRDQHWCFIAAQNTPVLPPSSKRWDVRHSLHGILRNGSSAQHPTSLHHSTSHPNRPWFGLYFLTPQ